MAGEIDDFELTPSRVLWAIIAVGSLWLFGWTIVAVGFALTWCLGAGCQAPAPSWVFILGLVMGGIVMLTAGPAAMRLTRLGWTWVASLGGPLGLVILIFGARLT